MFELIKSISSITNEKACVLYEIPIEVCKIDNFQKLLLKFCYNVYTQEPIDKWKECCIIPFPKKLPRHYSDMHIS